ncbi:LLM class flavin-dependent oxidoreductase [Pseudokineococcus lusitanus]|uniref:Alkanesulfonate monooxygenase SsuD/methylene tetrahydromethanopterin reductase-like flavin-dependent oxidoreductase (Luciferase family) n=1 Tax=Pseudokineococcus lusitanus TaxID=763993 RepID=A0A3N1GA99_9ACTN|nr:LLM class flavin-dependent oxidoreductase [Pseudokineococcus lusitanus]ROP27163.1 alkanesulfonate monooxygenase SsuD/methylene tetrahydromethanopterin reductase-like flavin-dependent oxidoreductase (luciferase family) [Pseudokineococcus lusitanus]
MPPTPLLGVELSDAGAHPAAWRLPAADPGHLHDPARWVSLVRAAQRGGLDLVLLPGGLGPADVDGGVRGRLDPLLTASFVAPLTTGVGLVPTVTTTHTEPFHVGKAVQTLDWVSRGRAGWEVAVSRSPEEAALVGRKDVAGGALEEEELWAEADDVAEVVARMEDSWEDDAEVRDVATGRFVDRDRIHAVAFEGDPFSVAGASITPRSPQGRPPVVVRADSAAALRFAARRADVVRVPAHDLATAVAHRRALHRLVAEAGRDPEEVALLVEVVAWLGPDAAERRDALDRWTPTNTNPGTVEHVGDAAGLADLVGAWTGGRDGGAGVDGVVVRPAVLPLDLDALVDDVVPLLRRRGLRPTGPPARTLRGTLGLDRPASRYARVPATAGGAR